MERRHVTPPDLTPVPEPEPDEARPYGSTAGRYHRTGSHPIPLPAGKKYPPPAGFTGYDGRYPTPGDVASWVREIPDGNVGLRLTPDVIGIDVDVYHGGDLGLDGLVQQWGPLPETVASTSRGDGSGIRLYRVPSGRFWTTNPAEGVDIIQAAHRYVVVYPSLHPEGGVYQWVDTASGEILSIEDLPDLADLPDLPWRWIEGLEAAGKGRFADGAATPAEVQSFKAAHVEAGRPGKLKGIETALSARTGAGKGRHDTLVEVGCWAMREAAAGFYSAAEAEAVLARWWAGAMADSPKRRDGIEFPAAMAWAIAEAGADVGRVAEIKAGAERYEAPALDQWIPDLTGVTLGPLLPDPAAPPPLPGEDPGRSSRRERAHLVDFRSLRDESADEEWAIYPIVPKGRGVSIAAGGGTGKSELLLAGVIDAVLGRGVYGQRPVAPIEVLYLDYEMTRGDLAARVEALGIDLDDDEVVAALNARLHYTTIPSFGPLDTAAGAEDVIRFIVEEFGRVDVVIVDTYSRAVGGAENEADTVRDFYRYTGSGLKNLGIALVRVDHVGKDATKGARGSSAKNDDVDLVWDLTRHQRGHTLKRGKTRVSWAPETISMVREEGDHGIRYRLDVGATHVYGATAADDAALLDDLGLDVSASNKVVAAALKAAGVAMSSRRRSDAIRWRREAAPRFTGGPHGAGSVEAARWTPEAPSSDAPVPPFTPLGDGVRETSETSGNAPGNATYPQPRGTGRGTGPTGLPENDDLPGETPSGNGSGNAGERDPDGYRGTSPTPKGGTGTVDTPDSSSDQTPDEGPAQTSWLV